MEIIFGKGKPGVLNIEAYRQAWVLYHSGLSLKQVGIIMGVHAERIRQRITRWDRRLRKYDHIAETTERLRMNLHRHPTDPIDGVF